MIRASQRGFVAIEWVAAIVFLLLPVLVLAGTLPTWAQRRHAATVAAREAAQAALAAGDRHGEVDTVVALVAEQHGLRAGDVHVVVRPASGRRDHVTVAVTVRMPAIALPAAGGVGAWSYTAVQHRRVDDYGSR